ncbi:hypothetical protein EHQ81_09865 [Leptospira selangorensis]|uniref:Uncharacterized protein n=1 Tax=Leptospira selangorensis TaxID=2484982 RepID=A0A4R9FXI7_9LEPT|nr:hypothetical protein [Leptospira selangorensis]TGK03564.1 hypothetical protein EHO58_14195 [Leptospira selangorensis]TGM14051.1 hypothetical protein EHQ81_09865 [Leptospira selangorensis]TGM27017.1 hypothetical protein EHQ82_03160 [Leptospira selangorensis]
MEKEPKNSEQGSEKIGGDLQEELRFFLENRLDGLLDEAEKFRQTKQSYKRGRSKFLRKESIPEKNQGFLPFIYSISKQREGNREEPESKVSGDES